MIYRIEVEGKEYNDNYTFETPKEGDILDELRAIVEDMEEGNIDKLKIEREALNLGCDKENKWRQILGVYTEIYF